MKRICAISTAVAVLALIMIGAAAADNPVWEQVGFSGYKVSDVAVDPVTSDVVFATVANLVDSLKVFDGVYKSIDAGATWSLVLDTSPSGFNLSLSCLAISESHPQVVWTGSNGSNKTFRSTDSGATWTQINVGSGFLNKVYGIEISTTNPYVVFVSGLEGLYKTTDGGGSFTQLDLDGALIGTWGLAVMKDDQNKLYAGAINDDVYKSEDFGETFVSVNEGLPEGYYSKALAIDSEDFNTVYTYMTKAQVKPQLWKSTDGGTTWIDLDENENLGNMLTLSADNLIFGSIVGNGLFYSTTSATGFATFANGLDDIDLYNVANSTDAWHFYGASNDGLWFIDIPSLPPGPPPVPEVTNNEGEREIYLSWDPVTVNGDGSEMNDLMGYVIYRALNQFLDENFEVIDTLIYNGETPTYTDYAFQTALYAYKTAGIDSSGVIGDQCNPYGGPVGVGVEGGGTPAPHVTALGQNSPNPFNPHTTITFSIGGVDPTRMNLSIYDLTGKLVITLLDGIVEPGHHTVVWNGNDTAGRSSASGVYLYTLEAGETRETRKMVLVK